MTIKKVCASYQSKAFEAILPLLTEEEADVLKRGRNATGTTVPKHASAVDYRRATAIETLFGYLYLKGEDDRLDEIFNAVWCVE